MNITYKCRLCGEVYYDGWTAEETDMHVTCNDCKEMVRHCVTLSRRERGW